MPARAVSVLASGTSERAVLADGRVRTRGLRVGLSPERRFVHAAFDAVIEKPASATGMGSHDAVSARCIYTNHNAIAGVGYKIVRICCKRSAIGGVRGHVGVVGLLNGRGVAKIRSH